MYKIYPLPVGESIEPEPRIFYLGDCSQNVRLWTYFWLIRGNGRNVLVDTGFDMSRGESLNPDMKQPEDWRPLNWLVKYGLRPSDIDTVVLTHLHWDHFSPTARHFDKAELWVNAIDLDTCLNPPFPWFSQFTFPDQIREFAEAGRFRVVSDDAIILDNIGVFHTGGHTPGNQSVAVQTEKGKAIIAGDVIFTYRNLEEGVPGGFNSNLMECFAAMERVRSEADIILPAHDPDVVQRHGWEIG